MSDYTDEQLMIALVKEDNISAFEELLTRYEKPLFNYIAKHLGDITSAQDIFQETFYRIYKNRQSFDLNLRFSSWAYRIATNLCINELKKRVHVLEVTLTDGNSIEEPASVGGSIEGSFQNSPEEKLLRKDFQDRIKDIVQSLPEKLKSVFILSEYQDMSCREIADILEIPIGTVKSRLHYGYKHLIGLLEKRGLVNEL